MLIYQTKKPFQGFLFLGGILYIIQSWLIWYSFLSSLKHWWFLNLAFLSYFALTVIKLKRLKEGIGSQINGLKRIRKRTIGNSKKGKRKKKKTHIYKIYTWTMACIVHSIVECSTVLAFNNLPFTNLTNNLQRSFYF